MALASLQVVDLTEALAGPYCTMLLGDLGAEVIKLERPGVGDQARAWGARRPGGESTYFCAVNRNKRSLALDLKAPEAEAILARLLAAADVLVCNVPRLASLERLGLHPATVGQRYPRLIYCAISGYGHSGPLAGLPGYDLVAQGEAGLMSVTGTAAMEPTRYPIPLADMTTGLYAALAILAAVLARQATGRGQFIDLSLLECQAAYLAILAGDYFATGQPPAPVGNAHPSIVPYQVFSTAGKPVVVAASTERLWAAFCQVLGLGPEVRDDPRFATNPARLAHRAELVPQLQARLATQSDDYWLPRLRAAEIPCGPINAVPDLLHSPHYIARQNLVQQGDLTTLASPLKLSATPPAYRRPPPRLGEHTQEILRELGLPAAAPEAE